MPFCTDNRSQQLWCSCMGSLVTLVFGFRNWSSSIIAGRWFFRKSFNLEPCSALVRKACRHCDGSFWCCLGRGVHESFLGAQVAWTHVQRGEMLGSELREFGILTAQFQLDAMQLLRVFQQGARWWRSPSLALDVLAGISWANPHSSRFCARVSEV